MKQTGRAAAGSTTRHVGADVALIGPVPPDFGGATPGGVATHQVHLAAGLADAGLRAPLLATNAVRGHAGFNPDPRASFPLFPLYHPRGTAAWLDPGYLRVVRPEIVARYLFKLARIRNRHYGSRRTALAQLLWYRAFLALQHPRLVHVQHPLERQLLVQTVAAWERLRIPVVVTVHSLFEEHPPDILETLMAPNLKRADFLIAVSPHVAEQAVELGARPERIRVIRSGADTTHFQPRDRAVARRSLGLSEGSPIILFVGNLEPRKGVNRLVEILPPLAEKFPGLLLALIGTGESAGSENQEQLLRDMVGRLHLQDHVRFLGRVTDQDLRGWYAAADVFALPSASEAQGIVALEAMASGLPVVASAVGGLLETIQDGLNGYLVPPHDPTALADRLRRLLESAQLRSAIGTAARTRVVEAYSWSRTVACTVDVYREVLQAA